jgi:hypothetical protein
VFDQPVNEVGTCANSTDKADESEDSHPFKGITEIGTPHMLPLFIWR